MRFTTARLALTSLILALATFIYLTQPTRFTWPHTPAHEPEPQRLATTPSPPAPAPASGKSSRPIPPPHNSTASPVILGFWKTWARHIAAARPKTGPVQVTWPAANVPAGRFEPDATRGKPASHIDISDQDVNSLKGSHAQFRGTLEDFHVEEEVKKLYAGTGIVTVAGGEFFGPSIVGIRMLRQTGSTLPVEVFLANWEEYEPQLCEEVYPSLNARCIVISDYATPENEKERVDGIPEITHFQLKALALLLSSFQQILYLDSDSIPLLDPQSELFSRPPYTHTGFVGWPDFWLGTEAAEFYAIAGMGEFPENLPQTSSESGQLLIDKGRHLRTLLLAAYYNVWGPEYYYPLLSQGGMGQGDKNTFETAAIVLGVPYYRVVTPVKSVGRKDADTFRGSGMVQFHPTDDWRKYGKPQKSVEAGSASPTAKAETALPTTHGGHAALSSGSRARRQVSELLGDVYPSMRPAFLHANTPKMNAGHLVDEGDLNDKDSGESLRLWGNAKDQIELFGDELEKRVWSELVKSGCDLQNVIYEWTDRKNICERLKGHWEAVFTKDE
jgi:alpha 1,2-mannosyltransferase